jgi:hypothetical protein
VPSAVARGEAQMFRIAVFCCGACQPDLNCTRTTPFTHHNPEPAYSKLSLLWILLITPLLYFCGVLYLHSQGFLPLRTTLAGLDPTYQQTSKQRHKHIIRRHIPQNVETTTEQRRSAWPSVYESTTNEYVFYSILCHRLVSCSRSCN